MFTFNNKVIIKSTVKFQDSLTGNEVEALHQLSLRLEAPQHIVHGVETHGVAAAVELVRGEGAALAVAPADD